MTDKKKRLSVIDQLNSSPTDTATKKPDTTQDGNSNTGLFRFDSTARNAVDPTKVLLVNPHDCTPYTYNDREFASLTQADVQDLIDGFIATGVGQLEPCIARKSTAGKYEIIAGTRRLKAALWIVDNTSLDFKLHIIVREIATDIDALAVMRGENSYNIPSGYERAISTKRHIEEIFGGNLSEYARVMNTSKAAISELMSFTQIPEICLDAYVSRRVIPIQHALTIRTQLNKHEVTPIWKKALLAKATELSKLTDKAEPAQILTTLLKAADMSLKKKKSAPERMAVAIGGKKNALTITRYHDDSLNVQLDAVCRQHADETIKALMAQLQKK